MKTFTHAVFPAIMLPALTAALTLSAIWYYEAKEQHRLRDTLLDQTLSAAEVFHRDNHAWSKPAFRP